MHRRSPAQPRTESAVGIVDHRGTSEADGKIRGKCARGPDPPLAVAETGEVAKPSVACGRAGSAELGQQHGRRGERLTLTVHELAQRFCELRVGERLREANWALTSNVFDQQVFSDRSVLRAVLEHDVLPVREDYTARDRR